MIPLHSRMPVAFGPFPGPRNVPPGRRDAKNTPRRTVASLVFETETHAVSPLLPDGFAPADDATITIEVQQLHEVDWLAGRGYSTLGVKVPAIFASRKGNVEGDFLVVLWENLADPVLSGREELGYAKLWCDIEETVRLGDSRRYVGQWLGHTFSEVELSGLEPDETPAKNRRPMLHYKHFPRTGRPGRADMAYVTMTPAENPGLVVEKRFRGRGTAAFHRSSWEQLPTLFHIVNALADVPLGPLRHANLTFSRGGKDLSDVHILEAR